MRLRDRLINGDLIFVSYKSEYREQVTWFSLYLKGQRFNPWQDADHLKEEIGEPWWEVLEATITESPVFIAFFTYEYFFKSEICPRELALAQKTKKFIIPIVLSEPEDETQRKAFYDRIKETGLRDIQTAKVVEAKDINVHVPLIVGKLDEKRVRRHLLYYWPRIFAALVLIAILGVGTVFAADTYLDSRVPNLNDFQQIADGEILRLAAAPDGRLYYAELNGDQTDIYHLDANRQAEKIQTLDADIVRDLHVDCNNTLWILWQRNRDYAGGVMTYPGDFMLDANSALVESWSLLYPDQYAVDSQCLPDGTVEVWLGGSGYVHTVQYSKGSTPTNNDALPPEEDRLYKITSGNLPIVSQTSTITDLQYRDGWLWVLDAATSSLLAVDLDTGIHRNLYPTQVPGDSLLVTADGSVYFARGNAGVFELNQEDNTFGVPFGSSIERLGWRPDVLWMGGSGCERQAGNCLQVRYRNNIHGYPVNFGVNDIIIDTFDHTWFATTDGLKAYS